MFGTHFREELDEPVAREFDLLYTRVRAALYKEHNVDGTHRTAGVTVLTETNGHIWKQGPHVIDDHTAADPNVAGLRPHDLPAGTYHNYAPPGIHTAVMVELEPTGAVTLTGLQCSTTLNKRYLDLRNRDSGVTVTLTHDDSGSLEQNRFELAGNASFLLGPHQTVRLYYDVERKRWCPVIGIALVSGRYTPTITNGTNVTSTVARELQYLRVGNTVTVSGYVTVDATADDTNTKFEMTLPFAATLANEGQLAGTGVSNNTECDAVAILANVSSNQAEFDWTTHDTNAQNIFFTFTYSI